MAYAPIAFTAPNYRDNANEWIKAYEPGTTTPKVMALESNGGTQVAKLQLNADGFIVSAGAALVIPYMSGAYDLWLFPTEAEADANNTANAIRLADNILGVLSDDQIDTLLINDLSQAYEFATVAAYKAFTTEFPVGKVIHLLDRGAKFTVITGTGSANEKDIISNSSTVQSASMTTINDVISAKAFGAVLDGVTDDTATLEYISTLGVRCSLDGDYSVTSDIVGDFVSYIPIESTGTGSITVKNLSTTDTPSKTRVWAHRGFNNYAPQNTLLAFSTAVKQNIYGIEFDVQWSADGTLYVFHDKTVDSLTDGTGTFTLLSDATINGLVFTALAGTPFAETRIPTLSSVLELAGRQNIKIMAELKYIWSDAQITQFINEVRAANFDNDNCYAGAGYIVYTEKLRELGGNMRLNYVGAGSLSVASPFIAKLQKLGKSALLWSQGEIEAEDFVGYCADRGVEVQAYTAETVINKNDMQKIGVHDLISDVAFFEGVV